MVSSAKFPVNWPNSNFRVYATGAKFGTSRVRLDEDNPPSQRPHKESRCVDTTTSGKVLEFPPFLSLPMSAPAVHPSHSQSSIEKKEYTSDSEAEVAKEEKGVDVTVGLIAGHGDDAELEHGTSHSLRKKLDWHMLPLLFALYLCE